MTDQARPMDDRQLEAALRALGRDLGYPVHADLSSQVAGRLAAAPAPAASRLRYLPALRPVRRSVVLAIAAVLLIAALATAAALGVPGIRILFGEPPTASSVPTPTAGSGAPPGSTLGLGARLGLAEAESMVDFAPRLPTDPGVGRPTVAYVGDDRLTYVWPAGPALPPTADPGVGLLLTEFRGVVDDGSYTKMVNSGTRIEVVQVDGHTGYWLSGREHFLVYEDAEGRTHETGWRVVGEVLIWNDGELTYRIESALGRDATIALAEGLATP
jgi:hypothetical protein